MISLQCDDEASACRAYADAQELFARQVSSKDGASQTISAAALALFCGLLAYHPGNVDRNFRADHPDQLWVADITYIPTWSGFLYLAIVLDVFSRRVVGWAMANYYAQSSCLKRSTWRFSGAGRSCYDPVRKARSQVVLASVQPRSKGTDQFASATNHERAIQPRIAWLRSLPVRYGSKTADAKNAARC